MSVTVATGSTIDLPVASIIWYSALILDKSDSIYIPNGFLYCDGTVLLQSKYLELYNRLKGAYNILKEDDSTIILDSNNNEYSIEEYFTIPDLRGMFIRGYDSRDTRSIGSYQSDNIKSHSHDLEIIKDTTGSNISLKGTTDLHNHSMSFGTANVNYSATGNLTVLTSVGGTNTTTKTTSNVSELYVTTPIDKIIYNVKDSIVGDVDETRPKNINLIPIIKY